MIVENNPEINVIELKKKIQATLSQFPEKPDMGALLATAKIQSAHASIEEKVKKIISLNVARSTMPRSLDRAPFNKIPFLGRIIIFLDRALFSRQREINREMLEMIDMLVETQKDFASDIQILLSQLKDHER